MLRRRSLRLRIVVLVLVPVLALVALYAEILNLSLGNLLTLRQQAAIRQLVILPVARVQAQLGNERSLALQFLARPDQGYLQQLLAQEQRTDRTIAQFGAAVRTALRSGPVPKERQAFLSWKYNLDHMSGLRGEVANQGLNTVDAAGAYSGLVSQGDNVLNQAITPVLAGPLGVQATDVLTMSTVAQTVGEESDLINADLIAGTFPAGDISLIGELSVLHTEQWNQTLPDLDPVLQAYFNDLIPQWSISTIAQLEGRVTSGQAAAAQVPLGTWGDAESAYQKGFARALARSNATIASKAHIRANDLAIKLGLVAGIGLAAILLVIGVGIILGRGLIRQLGDLRQSAVRLSSQQLPGAIGRLRAGEEVDIRAEVPELIPGRDEIGQVREAFNVAARTAIAAAADEVRIRRGVNDVFRSLARRNQSLLTRQLQLLDSMERRVHDPEELADLFRVDHMTTRMRRHAEGLLIVAGGSSGRTWREPVPIIDVMRAAAAEVEDYTRIKVSSRTGAALAGHAVADIIHLLAELVENAATFSPASTPVRVEGEKVARGVVVEIEDRGLGMSEDQLAAINATLADPPMFDLSGSDQLGLFIASQLAKRHNIRLTLRASAFGGITAVLLIPSDLVVDFDEPETDAPVAGIRELGGRPVPLLAPAASPTAEAASRPVTTEVTWQEITGYDWTASGNGPAVAAQATTGELDGLPVRVRQANLAPQLREPVAVPAEPSLPDGVPSPDAARSTMAALQSGWQRGRTAAAPDAPDDPADHEVPRHGGEPQDGPDKGGTS